MTTPGIDLFAMSDPLLSSNHHLQMSSAGFDFAMLGSRGPPSPPWDDDEDVLMDFKLEEVSQPLSASDVDEFLSYSPTSLRLDSDTDDAISSFLKSSAQEKEETVARCAALCYLEEDLKKSSSVMLWKDFCEPTNDDLVSNGILCTTCNVTFASMEAVSRHSCDVSDALLSEEEGSSLGSFSSSSSVDGNKSKLDDAVWKDFGVSFTSNEKTLNSDELCVKVEDVESLECVSCEAVFNSLSKLDSHICVDSRTSSMLDEDGSSLASFSSTDDDSSRPLWKDVCLTVVDKDNNVVVVDKLKTTSEVGHCSVCKLVFSSPQKLETHKKNFAAKVACCHCSKRFANVSKLRIHHRKHSKEKPFQCHCCGKYYTHRNTLVRHQQLYCLPLREKVDDENIAETDLNKEEDNMAKMIIDAIGKSGVETTTAKTKTKVPKEVKTKSEKGSTSCQICDNEFFDSQSLDNHREYHLKQRTCCHCHKVMGNKSKLLIHHRSHTKELPYACTVCERSFAEKSTLTKHAATHGERNFRCDLCDKAFVRKDYLAKHLLTHRQTYKCSQCSFVCYNRLDIEQHVAVHPTV